MKAKLPLALVVALGISLSLSGCASNKGGDTTCDNFRSMSSSDQKAVISKFEKDKGNNPSPAVLEGETLSAKAYCLLKPGTATISGIDG